MALARIDQSPPGFRTRESAICTNVLAAIPAGPGRLPAARARSSHQKNHRATILSRSQYDFHYTVIVAMVTVHVVEVTLHQVVRVIAVWDGLMSATWPVFVTLLVALAIVVRGAQCRVVPTYADPQERPGNSN